MANYIKNFIAKLLLLPLLALLGGFFLLFFLVSSQFKLFKDKSKVRPWSFTKRGKYGNEEKGKDYEPFY
jgi:hypothetical protein